MTTGKLPGSAITDFFFFAFYSWQKHTDSSAPPAVLEHDAFTVCIFTVEFNEKGCINF